MDQVLIKPCDEYIDRDLIETCFIYQSLCEALNVTKLDEIEINEDLGSFNISTSIQYINFMGKDGNMETIKKYQKYHNILWGHWLDIFFVIDYIGHYSAKDLMKYIYKNRDKLKEDAYDDSLKQIGSHPLFTRIIRKKFYKTGKIKIEREIAEMLHYKEYESLVKIKRFFENVDKIISLNKFIHISGPMKIGNTKYEDPILNELNELLKNIYTTYNDEDVLICNIDGIYRNIRLDYSSEIFLEMDKKLILTNPEVFLKSVKIRNISPKIQNNDGITL